MSIETLDKFRHKKKKACKKYTRELKSFESKLKLIHPETEGYENFNNRDKGEFRKGIGRNDERKKKENASEATAPASCGVQLNRWQANTCDFNRENAD